MRAPKIVFGIDFSGAQDAGNKVWIARGIPEGKRLLVQECFRARDLPNSVRVLADCLPTLVNLVTSNHNAAFGFDFPFGLPQCLVRAKTWEEFVLGFTSRFQGPGAILGRGAFPRPETKSDADSPTTRLTPKGRGQEERECEEECSKRKIDSSLQAVTFCVTICEL